MVLQADHVLRRRQVFRGRAARAAPEPRCLALIDKTLVQGTDDLFCLAEILVITLALAAEKSVYRVVKVVTPKSVASVSALRARADNPGVVLVGFRDHANLPAQFPGQRVHVLRDLRQNVLR